MVKGVNKTVIVVNDTGNEMFEKIVFYVTPKYSQANLRELKQAAEELSLKFGRGKNVNFTTLRKKHFKRKLFISGAVFLSTLSLFVLGIVLLF